MDERQAQIKEGAGLEDSRINTEFIDFLSKWSTPFFLLLLVGAVAMFGYRKLNDMRIAAIDQAYLDYDLATAGGNPSPSTLALLGEDYLDTRSVGLLAKLDEADIYLNSARAGIAPGSQPDPLTGEPAPEDVLTPEQVSSYLTSAGNAFGVVLANAETDNKPVFAVSAAFGSAAVLGSQGDTAGAKAMYEKAKSIAEGASMPLLVQIATDRAENIESLPDLTIYAEADLPALPTNDSALDAIIAPASDEAASDEASSGEATSDDPATGTTADDAAAVDSATDPVAEPVDAGASDDAPAANAEEPAPVESVDDAAGEQPPLSL